MRFLSYLLAWITIQFFGLALCFVLAFFFFPCTLKIRIAHFLYHTACRYYNFPCIFVYLLTSAATKTFILASSTFYSAYNILHTDCHNIVLQMFASAILIIYIICFYNISSYYWDSIKYCQDLLFLTFVAFFLLALRIKQLVTVFLCKRIKFLQDFQYTVQLQRRDSKNQLFFRDFLDIFRIDLCLGVSIIQEVKP